jgi:hypothetical protein
MPDLIPAPILAAAETAIRDELKASREVEPGALAKAALEAALPLLAEAAARKAAKWDRIAAAWEQYQAKGAWREGGGFDWDYDSRDLMRELQESTEPASPPGLQPGTGEGT